MLTEQERFWAGEFGDEYTQRCSDSGLVENNVALFQQALLGEGIKSAIEFGANIGLNLEALAELYPHVQMDAVEINESAADILRSKKLGRVYEQSILEFEPQRTWDLVLVKGVLIHINPDRLPDLYDTIYKASGRYILLAEYYSPTPVEIPYRGHGGKLFKRDFAGEMLDRFPDLKLVDFGFAYHRAKHPQDDINWFLMEKA